MHPAARQKSRAAGPNELVVGLATEQNSDRKVDFQAPVK
jgi:hypothetical protein